ncbi:MAG: Asp-tRNA(Asn)/Glu-tRNA(Gln) amidotransferase subunit GatB [Burkholderiales bacterium]|jgi:aspartyl-tRNA(Asn)/glutamyl-tRNA(Gln) amidotransferase subunit B
MEWEIVIGIETHAQLSTESKIFSGASTNFGADPNVNACEVDIALPGVLPVLNKKAVEKAIQFGIATGARVNRQSIFARKNYFYPDLPKGYQISQFENPVVEGGEIKISVDGEEKIIRLTRAHLEEDAGKSLHEDFVGMSGIDLNRAGTPLLEIVSEPDMRSAREAVEYARHLHTLVQWIGVCDGNMQEGNFRCDANVSVRKKGEKEFGTRREIKNLNSFRFLQQAIEFEAQWQIEQIEDGHKIIQATVLFDPDSGETRLMRTKEDAHDYRYFPDPDLLPLNIDEKWFTSVEQAMPELPLAKIERYVKDLGLSAIDAQSMVASKGISDFFESAISQIPESETRKISKLVANWINGDLAAALNKEQVELVDSPVTAKMIGDLAQRIADNTLSSKLAKQVFEGLWNGSGSVDEIIEKEGLKQLSDSSELETFADQVIAANPQQAEDFRGGKEKALNALVGQMMKLTKGKANPAQVNEILRKKLA